MATIPAVSVEYLHVPVTSSVELDQQEVELAVIKNTPDGDTSWIDATWIGDVAQTRTARLLIGPGTQVSLAAGNYSVWVRVHDTPEVPVRNAGQLKVN